MRGLGRVKQISCLSKTTVHAPSITVVAIQKSFFRPSDYHLNKEYKLGGRLINESVSGYQ